MKDDPSFRARSRAHGLLLSAHGTTIKDIAKTYQVHRVTVSAWIRNWEQHGAQSLHDKPRSGRPSVLRPEERAIALQYLKEEPQALKRVVQRFADKTAKRLSLSSLKRLAKKARLRWKRVRKSLKSLRQRNTFAQAKRELEALQHQEDQGQSRCIILMRLALRLIPRFPMLGKSPRTSSNCQPGNLGGSMCSGL